MKNPIVLDLGHYLCGSENVEVSESVTLRDIVALVVLHGITSNPTFNATVINRVGLLDTSFAIAEDFLKKREE